MAKYKFSVSTGLVGSERTDIVEIDDEYLQGTPEENEKVVNEYYDEWLGDRIYTGWEEVEE